MSKPKSFIEYCGGAVNEPVPETGKQYAYRGQLFYVEWNSAHTQLTAYRAENNTRDNEITNIVRQHAGQG